MEEDDMLKELKARQKEHYKNFERIFIIPTFEKINEITKTQKILISIPKYDINNYEASIEKDKEKGFIVEVENMIIPSLVDECRVEITIGKNNCVTQNAYIGFRGGKLTKNKDNNLFSGSLKSGLYLNEFNFHEQNEVSYYRFIIKIDKQRIYNYLSTEGFVDEKKFHATGFLKLSIGKNQFKLFENKFEEQTYFIIDTTQKIDLKEFSQICFSIMIGFGFLSSKFFQEEAFFVKSDNDRFETINGICYEKLRASSLGIFNPIYSNPYGYTRNEEIISKIGRELKVFSADLFSKLCKKIYEDLNYRTIILLLLEANTASLILRPAGYSVALEKITNIIVEENKGLKPIPVKSVAKRVRRELKQSLIKFETEIDNKEGFKILNIKIDNLNSPTNKDKLLKPFEIYDINLSQKEKNAIGNRNDFLHGNEIEIEKEDDEDTEIYKISLRLNKLVNKIILKHLGYQGYIVNYLKHNEDIFAENINEELFEKI